MIFHAVVPGSLFWLITQRASIPSGPRKVVGSDLAFPPLLLDEEVLVGCVADGGVLLKAIEAPTKITTMTTAPMRSNLPRRLATSR